MFCLATWEIASSWLAALTWTGCSLPSTLTSNNCPSPGTGSAVSSCVGSGVGSWVGSGFGASSSVGMFALCDCSLSGKISPSCSCLDLNESNNSWEIIGTPFCTVAQVVSPWVGLVCSRVPSLLRFNPISSRSELLIESISPTANLAAVLANLLSRSAEAGSISPASQASISASTLDI